MLIYLYYVVFILAVLLFEKSLQSFMIVYAFEDDLKILLKDKELQSFQESRYKKSSRVLLLLIVLPLMKFNLFYFILVCGVSFFEYKRPYLKLKQEFNQELSLVKYQFPIWLRQIQILLYTNNVLNAMIFSYDSAPSIIKDELQILINSLKENPNDLNAFLYFMSEYKINEIDRAMKLLYRTYIIDQSDTSKQLNRMIASTTKWIRFERLNRHEESIKTYEWIGIIPLLGVTLVFLVIMASLLNNLFGKGVTM